MGERVSCFIRRGLPLLGLMLVITACAGPQQAQANHKTLSNHPVPLANLHWCGSPLITFEDKQHSPPTIISNWPAIVPSLHLFIYLPPTLPAGSCLVTVEGAIHDTVQGDHFGISYLLPDRSPLSILESPLTGPASPFQCQVPSQSGAALICQGSRGQTAILIAARETRAQLQALFRSLATGVRWQPTS
jgi:hypothetical protein